MVSPALAHILLLAVVGVSLLLMLLRPRGISEMYWAGGGALLLVLLHLIPLTLAGQAVAAGLDVYLFLFGMMLLAELARDQFVFDWISSLAARHARGSRARLFTLVYGVGALVTVFLSNDATAVVLTPAILAVVRKARVRPLPYLFACALIANAASFVLPISNPANLVVFRQSVPPLQLWLLAFAVPSLLAVAVTYAALRTLFRRDLAGTIADGAADHPLSPAGALVLWGVALTVLVLLTASAFGRDLGLPTCLAALAVAAVVALKSRADPLRWLNKISWSTLALVAALFVMVYAVENIGGLGAADSALRWAAQRSPAGAVFIGGYFVGVAVNLVNNLPLGLIAGSAVRSVHAGRLMANAVLLGVDLGPNLSVTGSLATILWLIALRREGIDVSAWRFLRVGMIAMPLALLFALGGLLMAHTVFHLQ